MYARGSYSIFNYIILALYYLYSMIVTYRAKRSGNQIHFFPGVHLCFSVYHRNDRTGDALWYCSRMVCCGNCVAIN